MARLCSGLIDAALSQVSAAVAARACVRSGWLELAAPIPEPGLDDLSALRLNSHLSGSSRIARAWGSAWPYLRADAWIEDVEDLAERTRATCADFADAAHCIAHSIEQPLPRDLTSPVATADIERACAEAGWRTAATDGAGLRVEIGTRHGVYAARFESSTTAPPRFVVDLLELSGRAAACGQAAAALLMALSGSVRLVKGALGDRGAVLIACLGATSSSAAVDETLSALSVACAAAGREVQALMDERLASEYLAQSHGPRQNDPRALMEEEPCLQQQ